jgi:hypothetical protein
MIGTGLNAAGNRRAIPNSVDCCGSQVSLEKSGKLWARKGTPRVPAWNVRWVSRQASD